MSSRQGQHLPQAFYPSVWPVAVRVRSQICLFTFWLQLKSTDMQAAVGCAQLEKLPQFIAARKSNWSLLRSGFSDLEDCFILPAATDNSDPSWFGFLLTVRKKSGFTRDKLVEYLENKGIQTRMLFAGNLVKHPCFDRMREKEAGYRIAGSLQNTDTIMKDTFWLGVYPGLSESMIEYMIKQVREFIGK